MNYKTIAKNFNKLGCKRYKEGVYDEAITAFTHSIFFDMSETAKYLVNRGTAYYCKNEYSLALRDFNLAIKFNADFALSYVKRGYYFLEKYEYKLTQGNKKDEYLKMSICDFTKAINLGYLEPEVFVNRATAYDLLEDSVKALCDISRAIELFDPPNAHARVNRGTTYAEWGDWVHAKIDFDHAIRVASVYGHEINEIKRRIENVYNYHKL